MKKYRKGSRESELQVHRLLVLGRAQIIAFCGLFETTGFFQASSTTDGRGPREGQFSMKDSTESAEPGNYGVGFQILAKSRIRKHEKASWQRSWPMDDWPWWLSSKCFSKAVWLDLLGETGLFILHHLSKPSPRSRKRRHLHLHRHLIHVLKSECFLLWITSHSAQSFLQDLANLMTFDHISINQTF